MADTSPWLSADEQTLWRHWVQLNAELPAALNRDLQQQAGLSLSDYQVLVALTDSPQARLRVSDLARELAWERSRLSHHVTRMQSRGLVRRSECRDDGRGAWVVLTSRGRSAIERAAPGHAATVRRLIFDGLTAKERSVLTAVIDRALGRLAAECDPDPTGAGGGPDRRRASAGNAR